MAKKKQAGKKSTKAQEKAREEALAKEMEKRAEDARKSRLMANIFLYAILAIIAVFCIYTVVRTLFFTAPSVSELRANYLFLSLIAVPYLILTAAVVVRKLRKKARIEASTGIRRAENLLFLVVVLFAVSLFGVQMYRGRTDVSQHKVCTELAQCLDRSGLPVREAEEAASADEPADAWHDGEAEEAQDPEIMGFRSMLEQMSIERKLLCGDTAVTLNYHQGGSGVVSAFRRQAAANDSDHSPAQTQAGGVSVCSWPGEEDQPGRKGTICAYTDGAVVIIELDGPAEQTALLKPLLLEAVEKMLGD